MGRCTERLLKLACLALLTTGLASVASGAVERAEPLEVPHGPPPGPEHWQEIAATTRLELAAKEWQLHGYRELPLLAWAGLTLADRDSLPDLARQAGSWAPGLPGVQLEVARLTRSPGALFRSLALLPRSFPSAAWLLSFGLAGLGLGCLVGAGLVALLLFLRVLPLLGHSIGHLWPTQPVAAWPGVLALGCGLGILLVLGVGPALCVGLLAGLAISHLSKGEGRAVLGIVTLSAIALGPALDRWAALAAIPDSDSGLLAAWRTERRQPLPGDVELLEERFAQELASSVERVALATALKRQGDLDRVEVVLENLPQGTPSSARASAATLIGTVRLARGDVREAIEAFSQARGHRESAATLYNLSQAHGRALQLDDQSRLFGAARELDPDFISIATATADTNVHRYLLDVPVPMSAYLIQAAQPRPEGTFLAAQIRARTLGPWAPSWSWVLLPALGALGLVWRVRSVYRCARCFRTLCTRCASVPAKGSVCLRCKRLSVADNAVDPRVRRLESERDRWRRRLVARGLAILGASLPGTAEVLEGRAAAGTLRSTVAVLGGVFLHTALTQAAPAEVGGLATVFPVLCAILLLGTAYTLGALGALSRWTREESAS